jgi:phosphatidate cytidylyltransferase
MLMGYAILLWFCGSHYQISGYGLRDNFSLPVSLAGFIMLITGIFQKNTVGLKFFANAALGLLYISLSWGFMLHLYFVTRLNHGDLAFNLAPGNLPIIIIASIWINDTMAYIVGSLIGKKSLSKISPNKTWEGTIGGALLCVVVITLLSLIIPRATEMQWQHWFHIAAISAVAGTLGDLLESKLKRTAGIKDSGSFMPGHGGFLDRFDSLLVATPFVWLYVYLFV